MLKRCYINVKGIVQGAGFRPFIYRIALENNLRGWVNNTSKGVIVDIQGEDIDIKKFLLDLKDKAPVLSRIEDIVVTNKEMEIYNDLSIVSGVKEDGSMTLISPDIATCNECLAEFNDVNYSRRYKYAFTNCTNCGPRFSIIKALPYDRKNTTMNDFQLCEDCKKEYENPLNRRFHAELTCCSKCGPQLELLNKYGENVKCDDIFGEVNKLLCQGKIIAVKGLGGFNIICNGEDEDAIKLLRKRKNRKSKPLAIMFKNKDIANEYCEISSEESSILEGNKKPIVILKKKGKNLPNNVSFNNPTIGALLPYTPLHYLLFSDEIKVLVFTSGNISGGQMIYKNEEAIDSLKDIVDYFIVDNRDINFPIDNSVVRVVMGVERVIRPGRGYAPMNCKISDDKSILAFGSELKNTFTITKNNYCFTSPYIGNMDNLKAFENFERNLEHFRYMYDIYPEIIVRDKHPNYWGKEYMNNIEAKKVSVYHHHSHIVSCMVDNNEQDIVLGIAFDGVGYGEDGYTWGSEFLLCDYKNFKRLAHMDYFKLPGEDAATKEPWRIGISLVKETTKDSFYKELPNHFKKLNLKTIRFMLDTMDREVNAPLCCSIGRLFDGVASILGFMEQVTYEGEAAIYLENLAYKSESNKVYNFKIDLIDGVYVIDYRSIINNILKDMKNEIVKETIARRVHNTIIALTKEICLLIRGEYDINKVALSGGVFQNKILLEGIAKNLEEVNFNVLTHCKIPCNDSGISIGQVYIGKNI